jgi:HSP20 family protein
MKPDDIEPYDLHKRFFGRGRENFFEDIFKGFEETQREIEREFADIEKNMPKDLIREYTTPEGGTVKEAGPMVYGYSMTIGPDGRTNVREFGKVKRPSGLGLRGTQEPMIDVMSTEKEVKVTVEMPGVSKENIRINAYDSLMEVKSEDPQRKYHKTIDLPAEADIETAKSRYNNGILEITFEKKKETKLRKKKRK